MQFEIIVRTYNKYEICDEDLKIIYCLSNIIYIIYNIIDGVNRDASSLGLHGLEQLIDFSQLE